MIQRSSSIDLQASSIAQVIRIIGSGLFISALSFTITHPLKPVIGINANCQADPKLETLILNPRANANIPSPCQVAMAVYE